MSNKGHNICVLGIVLCLLVIMYDGLKWIIGMNNQTCIERLRDNNNKTNKSSGSGEEQERKINKNDKEKKKEKK